MVRANKVILTPDAKVLRSLRQKAGLSMRLAGKKKVLSKSGKKVERDCIYLTTGQNQLMK